MSKFTIKNTGDIYKSGLAIFFGLLAIFTFVFISDPPDSVGIPEEEFESYSETWLVTRVVDGDTIEVTQGFKRETVRFIGVDTPERGECFYADASNKLKQLVLGEEVELRLDDTQGDTDQYDRILRYVFLEDGTHVGEVMIDEGFAREYTFKRKYEFQETFRQGEDASRTERRGLWAETTCDGLVKGVGTSVSDPECLIKGNINSLGAYIYHLQGCRDYERTNISTSDGEMWFCSEREAVDLGWNKARSCSL